MLAIGILVKKQAYIQRLIAASRLRQSQSSTKRRPLNNVAAEDAVYLLRNNAVAAPWPFGTTVTTTDFAFLFVQPTLFFCVLLVRG